MFIFMLAHAGGNVWEYKKLMEVGDCTKVIPIELPGNFSRLLDSVHSSLEEYIEEAYEKILMNISNDYEEIGIFGHSFGAYLIYGLCKKLKSRVTKVVISGALPFHLLQDTQTLMTAINELDINKVSIPEIKIMVDEVIHKKIILLDRYMQSFKNAIPSQPLDISAEIIYSTNDIYDYDPTEWFHYFDEKKGRIHEMKGGHFYWIENDENREKLKMILENSFNI